MLFRKTVKNYEQVLTIIDNITEICYINALRVTGEKNNVYLQFNYEIKLIPLSDVLGTYLNEHMGSIEQLFNTFINEKDNLLLININKFYEVLVGVEKEESIIEWIEKYFYYNERALRTFRALHNKKEV